MVEHVRFLEVQSGIGGVVGQAAWHEPLHRRPHNHREQDSHSKVKCDGSAEILESALFFLHIAQKRNKSKEGQKDRPTDRHVSRDKKNCLGEKGNKAGYTAQDAPSMRTSHPRK